jgi:cation transport regulator ChaC
MEQTWIFGYGSLLWRPDFPSRERRPACIEGFVRRFWQGSTDHRGVVGAPGRVVTLLPRPGERTWGLAYRVGQSDRDEVLRRLDHRERGGYARHEVRLVFRDGGTAPGLVYRATEDNENYLGPAPMADVAAQVLRARGPSGANVEYVRELCRALRGLGVSDPHVEELDALLEQMGAAGQGPPESTT